MGPVVARHVKGIFVNRKYKKRELKMLLIKREANGMEHWGRSLPI